jgi:hypothetical protein
MPWLRWLVAGISLRRPRLQLNSLGQFMCNCGGQICTGTGFYPIPKVSPVNIIPPWFSFLIRILSGEWKYTHQRPQFWDIVPPSNNSGVVCYSEIEADIPWTQIDIFRHKKHTWNVYPHNLGGFCLPLFLSPAILPESDNVVNFREIPCAEPPLNDYNNKNDIKVKKS